MTGVTVVSSPAQRARGRLIDEQGQVGLLRHCATLGLEIHGPVSVRTLQSAVDHVLDRHPALRTTFPDGWDHHVLRTDLRVVVDRVIVTGADEQGRWDRAATFARDDAMRRFDLRRGPLMRATLLSVSPRRHLLVLSFDQMVVDAVSSVLVVDDLVEAAHLLESGAVLSPVSRDGYPEVRRAQADWLRSPSGLRTMEKRQAALHATTQALFAQRVPDSVDPDVLACHTIALDDGVAEVLSARAKKLRIVPFAVALAGLGLVASAEHDPAGVSPRVVTSMFASRVTPEEQAVVGWLSNRTAVVLPPLTGSVGDYLRRAQREVMAALDGQRTPLDLPVPPEQALTVSLLYIPGPLSGGAQTDLRIGAATARRLSVSFCPTGADVDLLVSEEVRWLANGDRSRLALAGISRRARVGEAQLTDLVTRWASALTLLSDLAWSAGPVADVATRLHRS